MPRSASDKASRVTIVTAAVASLILVATASKRVLSPEVFAFGWWTLLLGAVWSTLLAFQPRSQEPKD